MVDIAVKPLTSYEEEIKILKDRYLMIASQIRTLEVLETINKLETLVE